MKNMGDITIPTMEYDENGRLILTEQSRIYHDPQGECYSCSGDHFIIHHPGGALLCPRCTPSIHEQTYSRPDWM
jgi:hypothetical protein